MGYAKKSEKPQGFGSGASQTTTEKVNYQGKTPAAYSEFAARKTVEERFKLADTIARQGSDEIVQDIAFLQSRYVEKALADGTVTSLTLGHLVQGNDAHDEARQQVEQAVDAVFLAGDVETANFTNILSGSTSTLQLTGA